MTARPPARLIDLTRLVSRQGRGVLTGVDRVERAYLRRFLDDPFPVFGLVRSRLGFLLLDRPGVAMVRSMVEGGLWPGAPDLLARLTRRTQPARGAAETGLRHVALARAPHPLLSRILRRHLPEHSQCFLVGQSDLTKQVLGAMHKVSGVDVTVLLHDTIPLDHPDFSRPGVPEAFLRKMQAVSQGADRVICSTRDAQGKAEAHLARLGRVPPMVVAPLGIDRTNADPGGLPDGVRQGGPFFLCVGTIEPRKNHALLLDLWEAMHATLPEAAIPQLILAGARGWQNADVFRRLDTLPFVGRTVLEYPGLSDAAVAALMGRARALLFPSLAEGFGLPPAEALAAGLPVIAAPLPSLREVLGDAPTYVAIGDRDGWLAALRAAAATDTRRAPLILPDWDNHFNLVLNHR